jgi:hypothetical protein
MPLSEERTREIVVGYDVTNMTQEVETERTLYAAEGAVDTTDETADADTDVATGASMWTDADDAAVDGDVEAVGGGGVDTRLDAAAGDAAFLDGPIDPAANTAVSVGGTLGSATSGT